MLNRVLNRPLVHGQSALHLVVMAGQVRVVRWMVRHGARPDDRDEDGFCALHCAAMHEDTPTALALLTALVDAGAAVDMRNDDDGRTALHTAAFFNQLDALSWLLDHGATIDSRDDTGTTPLMLALAINHLKIADELLRRGADPNARDDDGEPVLLQMDRTPAQVERLLGHGADLQITDAHGRNLLHVAALRGDEVMVRWALGRGVDPTSLDVDGMTPLAALQFEMELLDIAALWRSQPHFGAIADLDSETLSSARLPTDDVFGRSLALLRRHRPSPVAQA